MMLATYRPILLFKQLRYTNIDIDVRESLYLTETPYVRNRHV